MMRKQLGLVLFVVAGLFWSAGCGCLPEFYIVDAYDLADALQRKGLEFDTIKEKASNVPYARIVQNLELRGKNLDVQIIMVEDVQSFEVLTSRDVKPNTQRYEWGKITTLEAKGDEVITKEPYIIYVRDEPEVGMVKKLVNRILLFQVH